MECLVQFVSFVFPGNVYAFTRNSGRLGCCTEREVVFSLVMIFWNVGCFLQFVVFSQGGLWGAGYPRHQTYSVQDFQTSGIPFLHHDTHTAPRQFSSHIRFVFVLITSAAIILRSRVRGDVYVKCVSDAVYVRETTLSSQNSCLPSLSSSSLPS